jgi:hypothetical protein
MLNRRIQEAEQKCQAERKQIEAEVDRQWQSYYQELELVNESEQIALASLKEGFQNQRQRLDAKYGVTPVTTVLAEKSLLDKAVDAITQL